MCLCVNITGGFSLAVWRSSGSVQNIVTAKITTINNNNPLR